MGICDQRVVIVTGAGGGLGAAHARVLAAEGAAVLVNDINVDAPRFFIDGINTEPVAATSATAEPDISAKNSETVTFTIAKPPRINPTNARQKSINLRLMLVVFIKQPARINKGIAINGKFVAPSNKVSAAL